MTRQCSSCGGFCKKSGCERENVVAQRTWVGLTYEEMDEALNSCDTTDIYKYFRAIEAKLKEKNT